MIKESDGDSYENMLSLNQDLTFIELENTFKERNLAIGVTQMKSLGLISKENVYTNLALLLSDQCPHIIKAATFNGLLKIDSKDYSSTALRKSLLNAIIHKDYSFSAST